jgi:hypothetical protein
LRASLSSGSSCHIARTTRRSSLVSPRSIARLPSATSWFERGRSRERLISDAASSKYHSHASLVRLNAALDSQARVVRFAGERLLVGRSFHSA